MYNLTRSGWPKENKKWLTQTSAQFDLRRGTIVQSGLQIGRSSRVARSGRQPAPESPGLRKIPAVTTIVSEMNTKIRSNH